jgi:hypothetical protein
MPIAPARAGVPVALAAALLAERPTRSHVAGLGLGALAVTLVVLA